MFSKINKKLHNMTTKDWIVMGLWVLTLVMLLAFVLVAGVVPKGHTGNDAVKAVAAKGVKAVAATSTDQAAKTYATALASVGGVFVLSLFSALITTVAFAYMNKKGGKND